MQLGAHTHTALVRAHTQTQRRTSDSLGAERNTSIFVLLWQQVHLRHNTGWSNSPTYCTTSRNTSISLQSQTALCRDYWWARLTLISVKQSLLQTVSWVTDNTKCLTHTDQTNLMSVLRQKCSHVTVFYFILCKHYLTLTLLFLSSQFISIYMLFNI